MISCWILAILFFIKFFYSFSFVITVSLLSSSVFSDFEPKFFIKYIIILFIIINYIFNNSFLFSKCSDNSYILITSSWRLNFTPRWKFLNLNSFIKCRLYNFQIIFLFIHFHKHLIQSFLHLILSAHFPAFLLKLSIYILFYYLIMYLLQIFHELLIFFIFSFSFFSFFQLYYFFPFIYFSTFSCVFISLSFDLFLAPFPNYIIYNYYLFSYIKLNLIYIILRN